MISESRIALPPDWWVDVQDCLIIHQVLYWAYTGVIAVSCALLVVQIVVYGWEGSGCFAAFMLKWINVC